jgi:voltage-gated potassium channel
VLIWLLRVLARPTGRHALILFGLATSVVIVGGILFSATEHVGVDSGLYWAVTTATTVGYGDISPKTGGGRIIATVVMLSTIPLLGAVFAVWSGAAAASHFRRLLHMGREFPTGAFRLVIGMHPVVPAMLEELASTGHDVVLVADVDPGTVRDDVHLVRGDPTLAETLKAAHPERATHALITGPDDGDVLVAVVLLRACAPTLSMTALVHAPSTAAALRDLGVNEAVSADELLSHTLAKVLEAPHAGELLLELLSSEQHCLDEVVLGPDAEGLLLSKVRNDRKDLVLGLVHQGSVTLGLGADPVLAAGDRLLVARGLTPAR